MANPFRQPVETLLIVCSKCKNERCHYIANECEVATKGSYVHNFYCQECQHQWSEDCTEENHIEAPLLHFDNVADLINEPKRWYSIHSGMRVANRRYAEGPAEGHTVSRNWIFRDYAYVRDRKTTALYVRQTYRGKGEHGSIECLPIYFGDVEQEWNRPPRLGLFIHPVYLDLHELRGKRGLQEREHLTTLQRDYIIVVEFHIRDFGTVLGQPMPPDACEADWDQLWQLAGSLQLDRALMDF